MQSHTEEKLQSVVEFVKANVVVVAEGRKCVDGRYLPDQASGMIARPGGDGGYVLALLAVNRKMQLGMTPEQCFNSVYKAVVHGNGRFYMHTDHQTDPGGEEHHGLIGCGHLSRAGLQELSSFYDVDCEDVARVIRYARNLSEISPAIEMVNLRGEFDETGVLVVESSAYSVNAEDYSFKRMYFVYDEERDNVFLQELVAEMKIPKVTFEEMKMESDVQLQATLHNLAKGLPVYTITFVEDQPHVRFTHRVV